MIRMVGVAPRFPVQTLRPSIVRPAARSVVRRSTPVTVRTLATHNKTLPQATRTLKTAGKIGVGTVGVLGAGVLAVGVFIPATMRYLAQAVADLQCWTEKKLDRLEDQYYAMKRHRRAAAEGASKGKKFSGAGPWRSGSSD